MAWVRSVRLLAASSIVCGQLAYLLPVVARVLGVLVLGETMAVSVLAGSRWSWRLAKHAKAGCAVQVSRCRWRGHHRAAATVSGCITGCLVSRLARTSARKRAYTPAETNAEISTYRHTRPSAGTAPARSMLPSMDKVNSDPCDRHPDRNAMDFRASNRDLIIFGHVG